MLILREMLRLALLAAPITFGLLASEAISLSDTYLSAHLGSAEIACIGLTAATGLIFHAGIYGCLSCLSVRASILYSRGEDATLRAEFAGSMLFALLAGSFASALMLGLIFVLLSWTAIPIPGGNLILYYWVPMALFLVPLAIISALKHQLEATGKAWIGLYLAISGVFLNIPVSYCLINGLYGFPRLGILGAGLGSLLTETLCAAAGLAFCARQFGLDLKAIGRAENGQLKRLVSEGIPLGIGYVAESSAVALASWMFVWLGVQSVAANQIVSAVLNLFYMVPLGMAASVTITVSAHLGAGAFDKAAGSGYASFLAVTLWTVLTSAILYFGGNRIALLFGAEPEVAAIASTLFVFLSAMQIVDGLQSTGLGALRGLQDYTYPTLVSVVSYWCLALPLGYLLAFQLELGPTGIWAGFALGLAFSATALPLRFVRLSKYRAAEASRKN